MNFVVSSLEKQQQDAQINTVNLWKTILLIVLLFSFMLALLYKLFDLQYVNYAKNLAAANKNYSKSIYELPERGVIYDRNQNLLVENKPVFALAINLDELDRFNEYTDFSQVIPHNYKEVLNKHNITINSGQIEKLNSDLKLGRDYFEITKFYSHDDYTAIATDLNNIKEDGLVTVIPTSFREYKGGEELSHILGYTSSVDEDTLNKDSWYTPNARLGVSGLESFYEEELRGTKGQKISIFSAKSSKLKTKTTGNTVSGYSLITTIDPNLQSVAYSSLKQMVNKIDAVGGAVVVQNPNTGEVLAIANYPSFDNNLFSKGISIDDYTNYLEDPKKPMLNRAIASAFPPASTFKIVTSSAGLQEKSLTANTTINDVGVINIGNFSYKTWKAGGHGVIDVMGALKESSDIFFYVLGGGHDSYPQIKGLGAAKLAEWTRAFNFGKTTGIDLGSESAGFVPDATWKQETLDEPWYVGNTYHFAIGQGFLTATPLQVNTMISAIANGGKVYKPYIVSKVVDTTTNEPVREHVPFVNSKLNLSSENINAVRQGLIQATSPGGTAYPLFYYPVQVAGKTGTAEFGVANEKGELPTHAWYTAYAPANDPQIAVTVFIENGGGGSDNAAPVAKDVLNAFFGFSEEDLKAAQPQPTIAPNEDGQESESTDE
jgi:penicillin-binding protein 2